MDNYKETYKEEAYELLTEMEASLLELEKMPDDINLISSVFRSMHTIKGSGAMFGFDDVAEFTHEVETVYDLVRDGKIPVTKSLIDLSLAACDQIRRMINGEEIDKTGTDNLTQSFRNMIGMPETDIISDLNDEPLDDTQKNITYRIRFHPEPDIFETGTNLLLLLDELRELGKCKVIPRTDKIPLLKDFDPEKCYFSWDMILITSKGIHAIRDVFIFIEDKCKVNIEFLDDSKPSSEQTDYKKLGEILVDHGYIKPEELKKALDTQKRVGEILVESKVLDIDTLASALAEQENVKQVIKKRQETISASSIRVAAEKLDILVNLVGELVTVQARLNQKASSQKDPDMHAIAEEVERLTGELRENTMSIRMLPIGATFNKFKRLVRDLSEELGKEVEIIIEGEETELDKTIIEHLNDPLMHIIRNTIDHEIEPPNIRTAKGKTSYGTIRMSAEYSGSNVLIRISGDGRGLDREAIRAKAIEKGLITPDMELSEKDILYLIFLPGFSTAKKVSGVSGRGVGLDVVKRRIESLHGSIEISSEKDIGTTVTLKLPLTLAIVDGLLVRIGEGYFVFPISEIEECLEFSSKEAEKARERNMMNFRKEAISYLSLREIFHINGDRPAVEQVVVIVENEENIGFGVDQVIGQRQIVIKSLGRFYNNVVGLSGATIMGDGTVALILDVHQLVRNLRFGD